MREAFATLDDFASGFESEEERDSASDVAR